VTQSAIAVAPLLRGVVSDHEALVLEDCALVERAAAGENAAFAELVRRHESRVRGLLVRLTSDRTLADDLAQEVFLRAFRGLPGFERRARFSTWLYRIAYNVFLNFRARTRVAVPLPAGFEDQTPAPSERADASGSDLRKDLRAAIETLPDRYRTVVTLFYLEDISYPEIAEVLDLPLGTVKTHLHRAKRMLRSQLQAWGHADE
jgi:RNA polymerase sigma-70 factor (ECF subfamily)